MADNPTTNAMPLPGSDEAIMRCCTGRRRPTMLRYEYADAMIVARRIKGDDNG